MKKARTRAIRHDSNGRLIISANGPTAHPEMSLRDALSLMLVEGTERLTVVDEDGRRTGTVALTSITRLIGPDEKAVRA